MAELDTNFVDAVLSANMNGKKRVRLTQIAENEYIVEDITEYEKVGSEYGQKEINTLNETVNGKVDKVEVIDDLDTVKAVTEDNVPVGCKAVTKFANDVEQSLRELNEGSVRFSTFEGTVDNWGSIGIVYPSDAHMLIGAYSSDYLLVPETHNPSVKFDSFRCFGRLQVQQLAIAPNGAKIKGWFYYI